MAQLNQSNLERLLEEIEEQQEFETERGDEPGALLENFRKAVETYLNCCTDSTKESREEDRINASFRAMEGPYMSISRNVKGYKPKDKKFERMEKIYHACEEEGISIPKEVADFFNHAEPHPEGVEIDIIHTEGDNPDGCEDWLEVKVSDIPKDVKVIRFIMSY